MDQEVINKLINLNKEFYNLVSASFDETRNFYWDGWIKVLPYFLSMSECVSEPKVLDLGCGNGRFCSFLTNKIPNFDPKNYIGLDFDNFLLEKARIANPKASFVKVDILDFDSLAKLFSNRTFNLIVVYGFMHHIPSFQKRVHFLNLLRNFLAPNGKISFSTWEFILKPHFWSRTIFLKKPIPWETIGLKESQIEKNDYLLSWSNKNKGIRYCHYISKREVKKLCQKSGLRILETYKSNCKGDKANRYFIVGV